MSLIKSWKWKRILSYSFAFLFLTTTIGPFLVPVPQLEGLVTEKELAEPDSKFIRINNVEIHYKEKGGGDNAFILLHGFGGSTYSWREVMDDFARYGHVIAYDRPAFGLSERPMPEDWVSNPYGMKANVELLRGLLDT